MSADPTGQQDAWERDLALVERVLAGDGHARDALCDRLVCVPRTLAILNARSGGRLGSEELADLAQDVVLTVWKKLGTFRGQATLESWAWSFCQLEYSNRSRRGRRRAAVRSGLEDVHEPESEDPDHVDYDHLERGLKALDPSEEEVIRLKHYEQLMFAEIAERLAISPNTAKTRYYRGMSRLRILLGPEEDRDR